MAKLDYDTPLIVNFESYAKLLTSSAHTTWKRPTTRRPSVTPFFVLAIDTLNKPATSNIHEQRLADQAQWTCGPLSSFHVCGRCCIFLKPLVLGTTNLRKLLLTSVR
jgi:hypothetical protein